MLLRIDNVFFNTTDVDGLAHHYSRLTGLPVRRSQVEAPGLMWAEIGIGGMELSFRLAGATPMIHPHLEGEFAENPPGRGATVSFEVADTAAERERLVGIGAKPHGQPINCSGGQEIISVFSDASGRLIQLYEPRYASVAGGGASTMGRSAGSPALSASPVQVGSNVRDIGGLAFSISCVDDDVSHSSAFYSELFESKPIQADGGIVRFDLDGATVELRSREFESELYGDDNNETLGFIPMLEVASLDRALARLSLAGLPSAPLPARRSKENRARLRDIDDNVVELWQRY